MKTIRGKIVDRQSILEEAFWRIMEEMYHYAQPSCSFKEEWDKALKHKEETGEMTDIINCHYLPEKLYTSLIDKYLEAYGIKEEFHDHLDLIKDYIESGGYKRVYKGESDDPHKTIEKLQPIKEVIGEDAAKTVSEYFEDADRFYRLGADESSFRWSVFDMGPTSNKEEVVKYWKSNGVDLDIKEYNEDEIFDLVYYGEILDEE